MARSLNIKNIITLGALACAGCCLLTGCFTGVESTKTITLSRQEMQRALPTAEDLYLSEYSGVPLSRWQAGRPFYVADDKVALVLVQRSLNPDPALNPHTGDILLYDGTQSEPHPDGIDTAIIRLRKEDHVFLFDTGKAYQQAASDFTSYDMQTLIDMESVSAIDRKMRGQKFWTRSSLWYDKEGDSFEGDKFIPVTVTAVKPADMVFQLKVEFVDEKGNYGFYYMNPEGAAGSASRKFQTLFYLDDLKKKYPRIEPDVWALIQQGRVRNGMTKEECRLSWGAPADADSGRNYSSTIDFWKYNGGKFLQFENGLLTAFRQ